MQSAEGRSIKFECVRKYAEMSPVSTNFSYESIRTSQENRAGKWKSVWRLCESTFGNWLHKVDEFDAKPLYSLRYFLIKSIEF